MSVTPTPNTRHPRYFKDDGNIFLIIGKTIFCVHASILNAHSGFFRSMFADGKPEDGEALSEEKALPLPEVEVEQLVMLLDMMYFHYPGRDLSVYDALSLLQLSDKFDVETAKKYALDKLSKRLIPPILRLQYGVTCNLANWVRIAYKDLIRQPIQRIPSAHIALVDPRLLLDVIRTKALCDDFRRGLYLDPPPVVHGPDCPLNEPCAAAWKLSFRAGFCLRYLSPDPDSYISPVDAALAFANVTIPGMMPECSQLTKAQFIGDGLFSYEDRILDSAVKAAFGQCSTEPVPTQLEAADLEYYDTLA